MKISEIPTAEQYANQFGYAVTKDWQEGWDTLREVLQRAPANRCTCGEPCTLDTIHRKDGPCIAAGASSLNETITLLQEAADETLELRAKIKRLEDEQRGWAQMNATLHRTVEAQESVLQAQDTIIARLRKPPQ